MCGGGSSSGGGTTQYNWNPTLAPAWTSAISNAQNQAATPYQAYTGQRIADFSNPQSIAMGEVQNYNTGVDNPTGTVNDAMAQTDNTLNGAYMPGAQNADPYAGQSNPWAQQMITPGTNQYVGDSPAFESALQQGQSDITNAYQRGTAADTTRMFNQAGAFGGSAYGNAVGANEYALGKSLDSYTSGMVNDQYNRSAQLQDAQLGRDLSADTTNKTQGNADFQAQMASGQSAYDAERANQMNAVGQGNNQQALALQRAQSLMGVGDAQRSMTQDQLNQQYNNYQTQLQYPYTQQDWLTGILGRAQGGISPNSTTTQSGYAASPFSQLLGGGLLASQFLGGG